MVMRSSVSTRGDANSRRLFASLPGQDVRAQRVSRPAVDPVTSAAHTS
jgi:hypothetical protein